MKTLENITKALIAPIIGASMIITTPVNGQNYDNTQIQETMIQNQKSKTDLILDFITQITSNQIETNQKVHDFYNHLLFGKFYYNNFKIQYLPNFNQNWLNDYNNILKKKIGNNNVFYSPNYFLVMNEFNKKILGLKSEKLTPEEEDLRSFQYNNEDKIDFVIQDAENTFTKELKERIDKERPGYIDKLLKTNNLKYIISDFFAVANKNKAFVHISLHPVDTYHKMTIEYYTLRRNCIVEKNNEKFEIKLILTDEDDYKSLYSTYLKRMFNE